MTEFYCSKCKSEGKDILLYYSEPPRPTDPWTKGREKNNDYRCKFHVKTDSHVLRRSKKNTQFREKKERIESYHRQKIIEFERMWDDDRVRHKPEPERLMEAFRLYDIRGQQGQIDGHTHDGFTAEEMTEIIRRLEIEFSASKYVEQWDRLNKDRLTRYTREEIKPELTRVLLDFESAIRQYNHKQNVNSTRGLIQSANYLYEKLGIYEKIVTTPGRRDPAGNVAPRFHLLTLEETLRLRKEKKERQINSTKASIESETVIQQKVQEELQRAAATNSSSANNNNDQQQS